MAENLIPPGTYAAKNPSTGLIEIIDMKTGAVLVVQRTHGDLYGTNRSALVPHILPSGETVLLERGVDPGAVVSTRSWPYSQMTADLICQLVAEGEPITKICNKVGMPPYHIFTRWRRENAGFRDQLEDARKDRAEAMRDLALQEALAADEDSATAQKLKHEAYKWAAGVDDQSRYSPKAKVEGSVAVPIQLVINTGIHREQFREIKDEDKSKAENIKSLSDSSGGGNAAAENNGQQSPVLEMAAVPSTSEK